MIYFLKQQPFAIQTGYHSYVNIGLPHCYFVTARSLIPFVFARC